MIDVFQIQDVEQLVEMKNDLNFFINKKIVAEIYIEQGKEKIELEIDRQMARELLENVLKRLKQFNQCDVEGAIKKVRGRVINSKV